jgi:hypothetical protein
MTHRIKLYKFHVLKCCMISAEGSRLLLQFGRHSWRPRDKKIAIFITI